MALMFELIVCHYIKVVKLAPFQPVNRWEYNDIDIPITII